MAYLCRHGPRSDRVSSDYMVEGEFGLLTDTGEVLVKHNSELKLLTGEQQGETDCTDGEVALGASGTLVAWRGRFYLFKFTAFVQHSPARFLAVLNADYTYTPFEG